MKRSRWESRYCLFGVAGLAVLGAAVLGSSCVPSGQAPLNCGQVDTVKQVASGAISADFTSAPDPNFSFQVELSGKYYTGDQTQSSYVTFSGLPSGSFTGVTWYVSGCNTAGLNNIAGPDTVTVP